MASSSTTLPRRSNEATDELTKLATGRALAPVGVFASDLHKPSVTYQGSAQGANKPPKPGSGAIPTPPPTDPEVMDIKEDPYAGPDPLPDCRIPYLKCLVCGILPPNRTEARRLAHHAKSFVLLDRELYKQSPTGIL
jgi:hypothetical protein